MCRVGALNLVLLALLSAFATRIPATSDISGADGSAETCSAIGECGPVVQHIVFADHDFETEGVGAKWRTVKWGLWMTLRLNQLLREKGVSNATAVWLPNPAQMMNPQAIVPSMMGGMGMVQSTVPPPALGNKSKTWLAKQVELGAYKKLKIRYAESKISQPDDMAIRRMLKKILDFPSGPYAFYIDGPHTVVHWQGRMGAWLHSAFYSHRLARLQRASGSHQPVRLPLPPGVEEGRYLISVHIRNFELDWWNLSGEYFVAAIRAIFASTPLSCDNSAVLVIGRTDVPQAATIKEAIECTHLLSRDVFEVEMGSEGPESNPHARDDYTAADDLDDSRRGFVFRDLELLGLSDFLITSHSEYSMLAMSLSSYDTIILCAPRRPYVHPDKDERPPCDRTGVPNSLLTHPSVWGDKAVRLNHLQTIDEPYVAKGLARMWKARVARGRDSPLWSSADQGISSFDPEVDVEASWPRNEIFEHSSRPDGQEDT